MDDFRIGNSDLLRKFEMDPKFRPDFQKSKNADTSKMPFFSADLRHVRTQSRFDFIGLIDVSRPDSAKYLIKLNRC